MTIDEMAKVWLAARVLNGNYGNLNIKELRELSMDAYIAGANVVLREIEDIVYRRYSEDSDGTERNKDLINRIKHLKGI